MATTNSSSGNSRTDVSSSYDTASSTRSTKRPEKINDALRVLDEAVSKEGFNLKELISSDYQGLKDAFSQLAPQIKDTVRQYGSQAYGYAQDYAKVGMERGREVAGQVDTRVRENPWPVIGGVAAGSLALGFLLGRRNSTSVPQP